MQEIDRRKYATASLQMPQRHEYDYLAQQLENSSCFKDLTPAWRQEPFNKIFNDLTKSLRSGIPFSGERINSPISAGDNLKNYLFGFVSDADRIRIFSDDFKIGRLDISGSIDCILDEARTKKFLSAVAFAVKEIGAQGNESIEVIDAGCGAMPILAIQAALTDPRVHVIALESNPAAAEMARQIIESAGLSKQIEVQIADATKYKPNKAPNIIVSETLHAGLSSESIIQILNNLRSSMAQGGRVIPERIDVSFGLVPIATKAERFFDMDGVDIPILASRHLKTISYGEDYQFKELKFEATLESPVDELSSLDASIEIHLGNDVLRSYESIITLPVHVIDKSEPDDEMALLIPAGSSPRIFINYIPGETPKGYFI